MAILRFDDEIVGKRHGFAVEAQTVTTLGGFMMFHAFRMF
jgi:hypothetical protein